MPRALCTLTFFNPNIIKLISFMLYTLKPYIIRNYTWASSKWLSELPPTKPVARSSASSLPQLKPSESSMNHDIKHQVVWVTSFGLIEQLLGGKPLKPKSTLQLLSGLFPPRSPIPIYTEKLVAT
jgi:hypothetical protein